MEMWIKMNNDNMKETKWNKKKKTKKKHEN